MRIESGLAVLSVSRDAVVVGAPGNIAPCSLHVASMSGFYIRAGVQTDEERGSSLDFHSWTTLARIFQVKSI